MIDTHCHLDKPEFDADREAVLRRAGEVGVSDVVVPAIGPEGWDPLARWAGRAAGVHFGLGIHPQVLPELDPASDGERLAALDSALSRGLAVGVGECGLDGPSVSAGAPMDRQVEVLRGHLRLARRHRLPVMLHCLRAHEALLALLAEEPLPAGGVLHSYSGGPDQVRAYARHGLHFSFAGPVTYERAKKPLEAARAVARNRLLVETDAPDQTPRPRRGRNEPSFLPGIVASLASALGLTAGELGELTSENARALFRLPPPA